MSTIQSKNLSGVRVNVWYSIWSLY